MRKQATAGPQRNGGPPPDGLLSLLRPVDGSHRGKQHAYDHRHAHPEDRPLRDVGLNPDAADDRRGGHEKGEEELTGGVEGGRAHGSQHTGPVLDSTNLALDLLHHRVVLGEKR